MNVQLENGKLYLDIETERPNNETGFVFIPKKIRHKKLKRRSICRSRGKLIPHNFKQDCKFDYELFKEVLMSNLDLDALQKWNRKAIENGLVDVKFTVNPYAKTDCENTDLVYRQALALLDPDPNTSEDITNKDL